MDIGSILAQPATWLIASATVIFYIYRLGTRNFNFFSDQGIPGPKPKPFFGNTWGIWNQDFLENSTKLAKEFGKVFGSFEGTTPKLNITDTNLIRSIFVKDFDHFINRRSFSGVSSTVFRWMLTSLVDQEWKDVRSAVTPTFTSGKIKRYAVQMKECVDAHCSHLQSVASEKGKMNLKDDFGILTMAVIAKCAFGMTIENLGSDDDPFIQKGKRILNPPSGSRLLQFLVFFMLPGWISKHLLSKVMPMDDWQFFYDAMATMAKERSISLQKYHDFPEIATESISAYTKKENGKTVPMWNKEQVNEIVTAQATLFMFAGYATTANGLTSCCFMLARHPEVQEKLHDLIMSKIDEYGDICHDLVQSIPYVDHVMNEVLRMHSPAPILERQCNKEVSYNGIRIPKDMIVSVSVHALHFSEEYYPDPETFNPERWNPENKANMDPYAFMPFGMGPRNCIANRFAQEEVKMVLCTLIKQFRFFPVEETPMKLTNDVGIGSLDPLESTVGIATRM